MGVSGLVHDSGEWFVIASIVGALRYPIRRWYACYDFRRDVCDVSESRERDVRRGEEEKRGPEEVLSHEKDDAVDDEIGDIVLVVASRTTGEDSEKAAISEISRMGFVTFVSVVAAE